MHGYYQRDNNDNNMILLKVRLHYDYKFTYVRYHFAGENLLSFVAIVVVLVLFTASV